MPMNSNHQRLLINARPFGGNPSQKKSGPSLHLAPHQELNCFTIIAIDHLQYDLRNLQ